jgi:ribosomal protein S18 acetylase RimI-like enzyme
LEVISRNEPAIRLYEKLGFGRTRSLYLMQASDLRTSSRTPDGVEFRELERPDMCHMASFGDEKPSWQNSAEAVRRSILMKRVIGAFEGDECVGYLVYSAGVARVSQIAVRPDRRRRGIGSGLLSRMLTDLRPGFEPQVINIDAGATDAVAFFESRGFGVVLEQYEMLKVL